MIILRMIQIALGRMRMRETGTRYHKSALRLVTKAQKDMEPTVMKTKAAQERYLKSNNTLYTASESKNVRYFLDAFLYKY